MKARKQRKVLQLRGICFWWAYSLSFIDHNGFTSESISFFKHLYLLYNLQFLIYKANNISGILWFDLTFKKQIQIVKMYLYF